jgi:hypothetical protein
MAAQAVAIANVQSPSNFEVPSPVRAKFGSSLFTPASAVFNSFGQIATPIIRAKTELPIFGHLFDIGVVPIIVAHLAW